jgi:hypothetical protein
MSHHLCTTFKQQQAVLHHQAIQQNTVQQKAGSNGPFNVYMTYRLHSFITTAQAQLVPGQEQ